MPKPSFPVRQQAGFLQVQLGHLGARGQRGLDPGLARQAQGVGLARQQAGGDHVARVAGVGAAGDGGDDHRAVRHQALLLLGQRLVQIDRRCRVRQGAGRQAACGLDGPAMLRTTVDRSNSSTRSYSAVASASAHRPAGLGVGLDQGSPARLATGQLEVVDGLLVDVEHRRGGAVFRAMLEMVARSPIDRLSGALAEELDRRPPLSTCAGTR
jgi:hypothetical protein